MRATSASRFRCAQGECFGLLVGCLQAARRLVGVVQHEKYKSRKFESFGARSCLAAARRLLVGCELAARRLLVSSSQAAKTAGCSQAASSSSEVPRSCFEVPRAKSPFEFFLSW